MASDWLRDARPLFTTLGASAPWTRERIERRVSQALEDGCDTLMAFVVDEGYALWPSGSVPMAPRAAGRDLVRDWCEASHAAGLRFVAQWMGVHVQTVTGARHPSWFQRDASGAPSPVMCLNSPFGSYLLGQIREVVAGYEVDGVYLDGLYARRGGCYCDACRPIFEALHEHPLRLEEPVATQEGRGHWLDAWGSGTAEGDDLARFRFDTVAWFTERLRRTIDAARPGTALILDTVGQEAGYWPNAHDLRRLRAWVDAFALECYPDQVREPLWQAAFASELLRVEGRAPIWSLRWISRDPDGDLVSVPQATLEAHVATAIAHDTAATIVEMDLYSVDESLRSAVRRGLRDARTARGWRASASATPLRWAGILADRRLQAASAARGAPRRALDPVAGAWLALTEAHLPVEIVTDEGLADGSALEGLAVLMVPDQGPLAAAEADAIADAVEDGMGLVVSARSLLGSLGRRLGITTLGAGHRAGRIGPESAGGSELVNYVRLDEHPITEGITPTLWSYPGTYVRLGEAPGSRLGAILDPDHAAMDGERWFGWLPGDEAWPLGWAFGLGAGQVAAWAAPLESVFFRQGRPEAGALLARAARATAKGEPAVVVEAPVTVESRTWTSADGYLVTLANRSTNDLYAIGAGVTIGAATSSMSGSGTGEGTLRAQFPRAIVPVAGVTVTIDGMAPAASVETLSGVGAAWRQADGRSVISLERLDAYEVIRVRR